MTDYDLRACLENNPQDGFAQGDIAEVLAVWEGQNDGDDWRWILRLNNGRFAFLQGGCDYTGWDCQSWATSILTDSAEDALKFGSAGELPISDTNNPANAGIGHTLAMLSGTYGQTKSDVLKSLQRQLTEGKARTWREEKDDEFGNPPFVDKQ